MSDYIKREDAIKAIMEYIRDGCDESDEFIDGTYKAKLIVEEDIPSADVVEVVRCKDCKGYEVCRNMKPISENDYCSWGKRKDGDKE